MALLWTKHGPHMVPKSGSSWFLINVPRDTQCQISHCWVYPVASFPRNGKNMAFSRPKHGPHMVLQISPSWILIIVPRDVPCQISHCWVYPISPFLEMAKTWPFYGQNLVLKWSLNWFFLNLNHYAQGCSMPNFTLLGVPCSPLS